MTLMEEFPDVQPYYAIEIFEEYLNPLTLYKIKYHIYHDRLQEMELFNLAEMTEIMFVADKLKARLCVIGEEVISEGDYADEMFIIYRGTTLVRIVDKHRIYGENAKSFMTKQLE